MANHAVARVDDTIDHGGKILTGSPTGSAEGKAIARVGDTVLCDAHGTVTITTGSASYSYESRKVARVTSLCSCGATIITGSPSKTCD